MKTSEQTLLKIFTLITADANKRREDAGYGGRVDDGGASLLETGVYFYKLGMEKRLPEEWESYFQQATNEADPEYAEYTRLKKKFG
jgi:hypothetical protein